jgi:hypothetical protein
VVPEPGNPQSLNRYAYVLNNPLAYTDPTGHRPSDGCTIEGCSLPAGLPPNGTWILPNGVISVIDPQLLAASDYNPIPNLVMGSAMLMGVAALPALAAGAAAYLPELATAGMAACADGDCTNEARSVRSALEWVNRDTIPGGQVLHRWGPATGTGPLGEKVAQAFSGASYSEVRLVEDTLLYRVYGGEATAMGSWWTRIPPKGSLQVQLDLAILPEWGNALTQMAKIQVPSGTIIYEGIASPQSNRLIQLLGGGSQVRIPYVNPAWLIK